MVESDAMMARIGRGMELSQCGERQAALHLFAEVWSDIGGELGDPLYRCALAHAMADVQDDVRDELVWDLRALHAADSITDERHPGRCDESGGRVLPVVASEPWRVLPQAR